MIRRWLALAALLVTSLAIGMLAGPADLSPREWWQALAGSPGPAATILWRVRLPRVATGALTGGMLAVSGVVFQALLRNPLAEPYLLGVSSGAALGAVSALALGLSGSAYFALPVAALAGALVAIAIVFEVARVGSRLDTQVLLLAGVVVSAFFGACVLLILTFVSTETLRSAFFWTLGSLSGASGGMILAMAAYSVPALVVLFGLSRHLNALALGEETAAYLGTEVERVKLLAFFLASLLAAAAVSVAGVIGFVGLVVPHAVRLWGIRDHRVLTPVSFLVGAAALVLADAVARTVAAPMEIPIGVVTAFLGVPMFLLLLRRAVRT
ncbi:MAG: iron ABC transporter permease [Candidatus Palauibacterales bacterium]|nr:iron ABC transporter permease [Candidatus Palauibacterales bacterium]